jgi:hypothetical protein
MDFFTEIPPITSYRNRTENKGKSFHRPYKEGKKQRIQSSMMRLVRGGNKCRFPGDPERRETGQDKDGD